jgi:C1A family cysteine protease
MKAALAQQPLAVSIQADTKAFQTYVSGVLSGDECGTTLDHAVLAVGFGIEDGVEYWLVKNSWATVWGDQGYIKLAVTDGLGTCGVQTSPLYPTSSV